MVYNVGNMKILVVSQYYYPESFAITGLCEGLVRLGHQVQVLTSKPQYGFGQIPKDYFKITDEIISGVNIHRVFTRPRKSTYLSTIINYVTFYRFAKKALAKFPPNYDVVLSVSLSPLMSIAPAIDFAKKHHLPHLLYAVDVWPESLLASRVLMPKHFLYKQLKKWSVSLYRKVDRILVGSPSYLVHFKSIVPPENVLPDPLIQPALIEGKSKEIIDYGEGLHIVYAGNLGPIQGLSQLIKQWQKLPNHIHLHLIGSGSQTQPLQNLVKAMHLQRQVHFYAHQTPDTLAKFFEDADAFYVGLVQPGIVGKTIPHKLIQYLTFGKPIISNLKGDGVTLLETFSKKYPLKLDASNLKTVLRKIENLTAEEKLAIRLELQTYYQQHLSIETASKKLENHLISLVNSLKS
jgi:hypothetical protein